jgi:hypothetical protein
MAKKEQGKKEPKTNGKKATVTEKKEKKAAKTAAKAKK